MSLLGPDKVDIHTLTPNPVMQIVFCTIGCTGCVMIFGTKGKALLYSALGSFLTWCIYLFVSEYIGADALKAILAGATFVAAYSLVIEYVAHIPATVFHTSCILPLLPGSNLFYAVVGAIANDKKMFQTQGHTLLLVCFGISFGFIIVDVLHKYLTMLLRKKG